MQPIQGVNRWLLELFAIRKKYRNRFWATRTQWEDLGGVVVRGDGTPVLDNDDENRVLFNLEQVDVRRGAPVSSLDRFWVASATFPDYELARRLVSDTGARVVLDDRCHCLVSEDPSRDFIGMTPYDPSWGEDDRWWTTMFHELVHWVALGFERLRWRGEYNQGELIADIGAAILTTHCGIPMSVGVRSKWDFVQDWIKNIRSDLSYLSDACVVAEIAATRILGWAEYGGWMLPISVLSIGEPVDSRGGK